MVDNEAIQPRELYERLLPENKHSSHLILSKHIWVQSAPMFGRLGMLSKRRCIKCGAQLHCTGICKLAIN